MKSCGEDRSVCHKNAECAYMYTLKEYMCQCHYGFIGDGYQCAPTPSHEGDYILFSQGMSILRMPLPSTGPTDKGYPLITKSHQIAVGLDVDCLNGYIYWTDVYTGKMHKAPYNGSNSEIVSQTLEDITGAPEGLAIDWVSRNIYWTDSRKKTLEVSNMDGSLHKVLINDNLVNPRGIAVNPGRYQVGILENVFVIYIFLYFSGKLYWSDWDRKGAKIETANLDGKMRSVLVSKDLMLPNNIVVDYEHNVRKARKY